MTPYRVNDPNIRRAIAAYGSGAWAEAESACVDVLRNDPDQPDALHILGNLRARAGDTRAAEPLFERARAVSPGNIFILNSLGGVYAANGRVHEARAALEAALRIDDRFPWALQNLGSLLMELGERTGARRCFERALESAPGHVDAIASLADLSEQEQRHAEADALARRALSLAPDHRTARLVQARLELHQGRHAGAERMLREMLAMAGLRPANQALVLGLLGQALEGQGRHDEAFSLFASANDIERALHAPRHAGAESVIAPATIARLAAFVQHADPAAWPRPPPDGARPPVFLVGFPRSGTTLLEQVLAAHPKIVALEERENLAEAAKALVMAPGALERWNSVSAAQLAGLRAAYWRSVEQGIGHMPADCVFVDKLPLNLALLPLIHLLFPDAKIILALRDPRDVIVSCFRNRFAMNAAMFQFLSLEAAAQYYDAVMALASAARAKLPLSLHELRYEEVVDDLRGTVGKLLGFLGLEWTDDVLNYAETAKRRQIRTPSAAQVRRPVYRSSLQQWRHYERQLAPIMPVVGRWARILGYEAREN